MCKTKITIGAAAAALFVISAAFCGYAEIPSREEIDQRYAEARPERWGVSLPGIVRTLGTKDDVLALTLDLCRGDAAAFDRELIDFLIENEIPATFFVSSRWIKKHAGDLALLASVPIFEIAAHGLRHLPASLSGRAAYGIKGTKGPRELYDEVTQNLDDIERATGTRPKFFRSGTAHYDEQAVALIRDLGILPVGYSILGDAGATYSARQVEIAVSKARSGDIIIAHANRPESGTAEGLIKALPRSIARGFRFVRLSEYLANDSSSP